MEHAVDTANIEAMVRHVPSALLVIFRIGGLALFAPVFASPLIPTRFRVLLIFALGFAVYPVLAATVEPAAAPATLAGLIVMAFGEITVGALVGLVASMPLVAVQTGGLVMGQQMGLGFARFYNPAIGDEADILEQMLFLMLLTAFVAAGGLEAMLTAVLNSFERMPPGTVLTGLFIERDVAGLLSALLMIAMEIALRVSAPLLAMVFLETVVLGFLAKTVPQFNILNIGFPIRIMLGLVVIILSLGPVGEALMDGCAVTFDMLDAFTAGGPHG